VNQKVSSEELKVKGENDGQVWRSGAGSGHDHCCITLEVNRKRERETGGRALDPGSCLLV